MTARLMTNLNHWMRCSRRTSILKCHWSELESKALILAPNGAGKTSWLLKSAEECFRQYPLQVTGIYWGNHTLLRQNSVMDNLKWAYHCRYINQTIAITPSLFKTTLHRWGLSPFAHHQAGNLSQGFQTRLGLAMATLGPTERVLMDEPFTHLDEAGKSLLVDWLLNFSGQCILTDTEDRQALGGVFQCLCY